MLLEPGLAPIGLGQKGPLTETPTKRTTENDDAYEITLTKRKTIYISLFTKDETLETHGAHHPRSVLLVVLIPESSLANR
jgi:hypothetical protein